MSDVTERNLAMLLQHAYVEVTDERIEAAIARVRARRAPRRPAVSLPALAAAALMAVAALWMTGRGPQPVVPVAVTSPSAPQDPASPGEDPEIAELTRQLEKTPDSVDVLLKRGARYRALWDTARALADVEKALKLNPDSAEAWLLRAQIPLGAYPVREAAADRALALRPGWAAAHLARARLSDLIRVPWFEMVNRTSLAFRIPKVASRTSILADCDEAIRLEPGLAEAYVVRAAQKALQRMEGAVEDVARALELQPGHAEAHLMRARLKLMGRDANVADVRSDILLAALGGAEVEPALLEQLTTEDRTRLRAGRASATLGVRTWSQQQDRLSEIRDLIGQLDSPDEAVRKGIEEKLFEHGEPALAELRRALYHRNPEIRVRSQEVADRVGERLRVRGRVQDVLRAAGKLREMWKSRAFEDLEEDAARLFEGGVSCQYVPRKKISDRFRLQVKDGPSITQEMAEVLDKDPGVAFVYSAKNKEGRLVDHLLPYAGTAVITLPDAEGWSAYVVVMGLPLD